MFPPRSPYGLIQEDVWPNEWAILLCCMLLNCTTRRSAEKVLPRILKKYPDAAAMAAADQQELSEIIRVLGFGNRRAKNIIDMSKAYVRGNWTHASQLPGIGEYASAAWEIFVKNRLPPECPKDSALTLYYKWRKKHDNQKDEGTGTEGKKSQQGNRH